MNGRSLYFKKVFLIIEVTEQYLEQSKVSHFFLFLQTPIMCLRISEYFSDCHVYSRSRSCFCFEQLMYTFDLYVRIVKEEH